MYARHLWRCARALPSFTHFGVPRRLAGSGCSTISGFHSKDSEEHHVLLKSWPLTTRAKCDVSVSSMTTDDAEFAADVFVKAFEGILVHAAGREKLG